MTKVQRDYELLRPLGACDAAAVEDVHGYYGIQHVTAAGSLDRITVVYDASRLSEQDVEAVLIRYGIPVRRQTVAAR